MIIPDELKAAYRSGRLMVFVGAGASMSVQWTTNGTVSCGPSWGELVNKAADLLGVANPALLRARGTDLQILEYFKAKYGNHQKLTNWFHTNMRPPDADLAKSRIHEELAAMEKCRLIYTTNYDDFIERSFGLRNRRCKVVVREADMASPEMTEVVKFHGDWDHPDAMVLSEADYQRRFAFEEPLDYRFRADILNRIVLFVGYSFTDANVAYLFHRVNLEHKSRPGLGSGQRAYVTVTEPSNFEKELFQRRGVGLIPLRLESMTDDVVQALRAIRGVQ